MRRAQDPTEKTLQNRIISRPPYAFAAFYTSLLTYSALALGLGSLLWRLGPGRGHLSQGEATMAVVIVVAFCGAAVYVSREFRAAAGRTVEEVIDNGDSLLVRRGSEQARIALSDIERVHGRSGWEIALSLGKDTPPFGREIIFLQNPWVRSAGVYNGVDFRFVSALRERCLAARRTVAEGASAMVPSVS